MVTSNAIRRTFHIKVGEQTATCFLIDIDDQQYLVTAKHIVSGFTHEGTISIAHDRQWKNLPTKLVGHAPGEADISVLALPYRIAGADLSLPPDAKGLTVGQEVYFLGYPFGLFGEMGKENNNYPLPFVKRGVVSCFEHNNHDLHRVFLDGHNNPGFSGGPVVFQPPGATNFQVAAVISGYRYENLPVFHGEEALPLITRHNTGIVFTYGIGYATALVRENPIGPK